MTQKIFSSRAICLEEHSPLKNTLCIDCLSKYLEKWMEGKSENIKKIVRKELSNNSIDKIEGEECLICNKNKTLFCPYCFIDIIHEKIKDIDKENCNSILELF